MNWKIIIGIIISAAFLFLAFRKVNPDELIIALENARYIYILPAVLLLLLSIWIRVFRWRYLTSLIKEIKLGSLFSATIIGLMANNLLPARLGEFVRAYVIGEKENISKSSSFATIVVERILDGFTLLFFLVIVIVFYAFSFPGWLRRAAIITLVFYLFAISFLILLRVKTGLALTIVEFIMRPFSERFRSLVIRFLNSFIEGLKILHSAKNVLVSALLSLLVWLPHIFIINFLLISFGIHLPLFASALLLVTLGIAVAIPSAPGFVGTVQYFCVAFLAIFAVPKSQALSFSIVYHASAFIPVTAIGLIYLVKEGLSFADIRGTTGKGKM